MHPRFLLALAVGAAAHAQAPSGYYASVNTSSPALLRSTLHAAIDDHLRIPYTATATDTWNVLELADQHPTDASLILDVYKNAAYAKVGAGNTLYDREHSWPKSFGYPNDVVANYPYTDCHALFLCDSSYNSSRSNKPYDNGLASWAEKITEANAGAGGGSGVFPGNSNWTEGTSLLGAWQTWNSRKGDVARALMYLDVRYDGGTHAVTGAAEPDLILTDDLNLIAASNTGANLSVGYMGKLSILRQWHAQDPVDAREVARNNAVYAAQGNRNPFIDNPQWVECLYGTTCSAPPQPAVVPWINEIHYDNNGKDRNERVEIVAAAGTSFAGWKLIGYDGANGATYATITLSGTTPNQQNGLGTLAFNFTNLQDGAPDGIALVNASNQVVQFLSYEGTFTATNGPAAGLTSVNIGVTESPTSALGLSLQLGGTGSSYAQFTWQTARTSTWGAVNANQTLQ
jgi:endonuclease I